MKVPLEKLIDTFLIQMPLWSSGTFLSVIVFSLTALYNEAKSLTEDVILHPSILLPSTIKQMIDKQTRHPYVCFCYNEKEFYGIEGIKQYPSFS